MQHSSIGNRVPAKVSSVSQHCLHRSICRAMLRGFMRHSLHDAWRHHVPGRNVYNYSWHGVLRASAHRAGASNVLAPPDLHQMRKLAGVAFPPGPPPLSEDLPSWTDKVAASCVDVRRRIFCNRSLNMASIQAVGFDMDYTMAQYKPETFEKLAFDLTIRKLVEAFGYPKQILTWDFDWRYMVRGLVIDKKRGNMLKIDRHKYVKLAYHGFKRMSREQRRDIYSNNAVRFEFDEPDFAMIDTLFSLAEAHLFMQLVELQDSDPGQLPAGKNTDDLYRDVRAAVDLCHRDGSLKTAVAKDPSKYIHEDHRLVMLCQTYKRSGRKLFLATNSLWDYTHVVMNYLLGGRVGPDKNEDWLELFDVVITGCGKPAFFESRKPLFEVHTSTGMLRNTDSGNPMVPIGEEDVPDLVFNSSAPDVSCDEMDGLGEARKARVFQGGTYADLHKMLGVKAGSQVLYIGDHIYGDVLSSKKKLGWRTMLVVPELEAELEILSSNRAGCSFTVLCQAVIRDLTAVLVFNEQQSNMGVTEELDELRLQRDSLDDQVQRIEWALREEAAQGDSGAAGTTQQWETVRRLNQERTAVKEQHKIVLEKHHRRFHPIWGQLLKTGYQNSRFAHQVERFACLYTSHVSNLTFYSPEKSFRGRMDTMAHEEEPSMEKIVN